MWILPAAVPPMVVMLIAQPASAAVVAISPFVGQASETFNQFSNTLAVQSLSVFDGLATLDNLSPGGAIKVEFSSAFLTHQVLPISGMMAGQLGIGQWTFAQPVSRFGGWWENNSGQPDATVAFYDSQDALIDQVTANVPYAQTWTWNGWASDTPIKRIVVTGNGVVNGFLWYENMQIDFAVPGPSGSMVFFVLFARRSRRR